MRLIDNRTGLEVVSRDDCLRLLAQNRSQVGRLAVVDGLHPVILPINYVLNGEDIVFRTAAGTKLDSALHGANVAFEVDELDAEQHLGWSVLVKGRSTLVTSPQELHYLETLPLRPWSDNDKPNWIRIVPESVTGRRVSSTAQFFH